MTDSDYFDFTFTLEGELKDGNIFPILYRIYRNNISGLLIIKNEKSEKKIHIRDRKIIFVTSTHPSDSFSNFLVNQKRITSDLYPMAISYADQNHKRFGRAMIELGYCSYEQVWTWVPAHLNHLLVSIFDMENSDSGTYRIIEMGDRDDHDVPIENITLNVGILDALIDGIRRFKRTDVFEKKLHDVENLYVVYANFQMLSQLDLKPYELHVYDLVKREERLEHILKGSELMEKDTRRLLYLFLLLGVISTQKPSAAIPHDPPEEIDSLPMRRQCAFTSFEEALKYYNTKYEIIFKVMLKKIGPIAFSILLKAIEDILDNLPSYFQKIHLNSDGTINEQIILKSLWYYDFDRHIAEFLKGLEDILYTEMFAVKRHLGVEIEQQVVRWIKGIGN
ncbi:MAG: DUF4388 domain-containing protein [Candidatus Omnitrophota bacterium]